jgi:hypothetical protein
VVSLNHESLAFCYQSKQAFEADFEKQATTRPSIVSIRDGARKWSYLISAPSDLFRLDESGKGHYDHEVLNRCIAESRHVLRTGQRVRPRWHSSKPSSDDWSDPENITGRSLPEHPPPNGRVKKGAHPSEDTATQVPEWLLEELMHEGDWNPADARYVDMSDA